MTHEHDDPRVRSERRALAIAALIAAGAISYMMEPIALGILLGTLLAFMVQPVYGRLQRKLGLKAAAIVTVAATTVAVLGSMVGIGYLLGSKGNVHARELIAALGPDAPGGGALAALGRQLSKLGIAPEELPEKARQVAETAAARVAVGASAILAITATTLLALFFMMLSMHFVLRNAQTVVRIAKDTLPLRPEWTMALFAEFRRVGKTTLFGTIITGVAQGVLATIGFWICGVPDPIFYGAATAVASLVPAVGTLLVWVPVGIVLIVLGHPFAGAMELVWGGLVVVGISDYVIRPRLVGGESELPSLLTFAALFGGVEVFGLKGLIVGPLVMSLAIAVLRIWTREMQNQRALPNG